MLQADELRALCQRIIQSGELGRSRTYAAILEYLAEQAIEGTSPKEISIAMEVLGRGPEFDVGKDSIVRVHIYHLRNKLDAYFARHGRKEKYRLEIPKGQYMLVSSLNQPEEDEAQGGVSVTGRELRRRPLTPWLAAVAIVLLLTNIFIGYEQRQPAANPYLQNPLWQPILDDELPVLVLVGDYYIMGETDQGGNVLRMVREFGINSSQDLMLEQQAGRDIDYLNLDLAYTPTSVPVALAELMKVFGSDARRVRVKMMSQFNAEDLVGKHVVYLGYLSGLQNLADLMFAASGLATGMTYDELIDLDSEQVFASSSGLSTGYQNYRDYGMLSTFPAPGGNQFLFLAGMRDEGLINLAQEVTRPESMQNLEQELPAMSAEDTAFEALYEVLGFSNTNMDASLVYSQPLDTEVLWEARLIGAQ